MGLCKRKISGYGPAIIPVILTGVHSWLCSAGMEKITTLCMMICLPLLLAAAPRGVFVNQLGYRPDDNKVFITNLGETKFEVILLETGRPVHAGTTRLQEKQDAASGMDLYHGDFSAVRDPGIYRIRLRDGSVSYPFRIAADVYEAMARASLHSFFLQRCGVPMDATHAGPFERGSCHLEDAHYHPEIGMAGGRTVTGGWHDAGDFGKYIHSASVSLAHMLMMYEQFPERFDGDDTGIPESGNGIPDFLDEMQFELDWMLRMQVAEAGDSQMGGVHYMVNTRDYSWTTAENDKDERFLYAVTSVSTADFAAAMALAARVFRAVPQLESRASRYQEAALLAWDFLERHPGLYPAGGFIRPADTKTGGYADSPDMNDLDDRLWAAVELGLTTGDSRFIKDLASLNDSYLAERFFDSQSFDHELQWQDTSAFPFVQAALHPIPGLPASIHQRIQQQYLDYCERVLQRVHDDGFAVALNRYYWGSAGGTLAFGQMLLFGHKIDPRRDGYIDAALDQLHWVLGRNAVDTSFVSGFGSRYPLAIHHATFENDGIDQIFPGLLAGGPNPGLGGDYTLPKYFDENTPPALCYIDHMDSWASNENCILYNAPLVALSYYFR